MAKLFSFSQHPSRNVRVTGDRNRRAKNIQYRKTGETKKKVEISLVKQGRVESRVNWPQAKTGHWTASAGTDCSCHCSARAWVPARTCQKLAVTLIYTEEPCCFLFSPNVPRDKLKSPARFMRALWDRERESYTVTHPWLVLETWQCFSFMLVLTCLTTLVVRDYLSLSVLFFFLVF